MANILLVSHWTGGDVLPFMKMGAVLKKANHNVTIFTHCIYESIAKEHGLNFVPLDTYEEYNDMVNNLELLNDPIRNLKGTLEFNRRFHNYEKIYAEHSKIVQYINSENTVIIFRHRSSISGLLAAETSHVPSISVFLAPNYCDHLKLHDEIMGQYMIEEINKVRSKFDLPHISCWSEWMCSSTLVVGLWPEWFAEKNENWPNSLIPIGFCPNNELENAISSDLISELLVDKPVLISGGTSKLIHPNFYTLAQEACYMLGQKAILVTPHEDLLPKEIRPGVKVYNELPLKEIMPYVKCIIHHGGIGTMSEAIYAGTPQLILPCYVDRLDNAQRISKYNISEYLPLAKWSVNNVAQKLLKIVSESYKCNCTAFSKEAFNEKFEEKLNSVVSSLFKQ